MNRCFGYVLIASLVGLVQNCYSQGPHSQVTASAGYVEAGPVDSFTGQVTAIANFNGDYGESARGVASVGPLEIELEDGKEKTALAFKAFATATGGTGQGQFISARGLATVSWDETLYLDDADREGDFDIYLKFVFGMHGKASGDTVSDFNLTVTDTFTGEPIIFKRELDLFDEDFENVPYTWVWPKSDFQFAPVDLNFSLKALATGHGSAFGLPHTSMADFSQTITLLSITPLDAQGNFVPGISLQSSSGFDYNALIVPEPTGFLLMVFAVSALFTNRKRLLA